jgi:hypothetical protein
MNKSFKIEYYIRKQLNNNNNLKGRDWTVVIGAVIVVENQLYIRKIFIVPRQRK